ncbi:MAG: AAA family ATPase [Candidatus Sumerlaeia bacterium]|nr:AAA family ATPase [Candidatus Sumerlaeia bacterium]
MAATLTSLTLSGWKSYGKIDAFDPGRISVLLGGNGSGKSNLISFFSLLRRMMADPGELQLAVAQAGGARKLLHDGPKKTKEITATLDFEREGKRLSYAISLAFGASDTLVIEREEWSAPSPSPDSETRSARRFLYDKSVGRREVVLRAHADMGNDAQSPIICDFLRSCVVYQFHDTSLTSGLRGKSSTANGRHLHWDGANLAAFLYRLANGDSEQRDAYQRIQRTVRQVAPFFAEFVLEPESGYVLLQWREVGCEEIFSASQASDGMLRIIALMTLLCQPEANLPSLMLLDEPELGLHPHAITLLGALIRKASEHCQVMVATQSVQLVDEFSLDEIVVVSRAGRESTLRRLSEEEYAVWLEEYSSGELWRKNVIGGGPVQGNVFM